jgi:hypothetical protein
MDQGSAIGEQTIHRCLQVGHLKRKTDGSADAPAGFYVVDGVGVGLVEDFERCIAHFDDKRLALVASPYLRGFKAEAIAIEPHEAFIIGGGEGDTQFYDGRKVSGRFV